MDYFHLDDNYIIRGKEKGNKMIHPDYIDIFKQGFKDRISGKKLDEPWEYRILDGSTYNRFTAMAKMLYDSYGKPFIIVIRYNNSGIADEIHNIYNKITDTLSNTIEVEGKRIPLKNSEVLFLIFLKKLVPSQKNYALNYHLMN